MENSSRENQFCRPRGRAKKMLQDGSKALSNPMSQVVRLHRLEIRPRRGIDSTVGPFFELSPYVYRVTSGGDADRTPRFDQSRTKAGPIVSRLKCPLAGGFLTILELIKVPLKLQFKFLLYLLYPRPGGRGKGL